MGVTAMDGPEALWPSDVNWFCSIANTTNLHSNVFTFTCYNASVVRVKELELIELDKPVY
jgi:hypothetical protein